jgi:hypothetical protein
VRGSSGKYSAVKPHSSGHDGGAPRQQDSSSNGGGGAVNKNSRSQSVDINNSNSKRSGSVKVVKTLLSSAAQLELSSAAANTSGKQNVTPSKMTRKNSTKIVQSTADDSTPIKNNTINSKSFRVNPTQSETLNTANITTPKTTAKLPHSGTARGRSTLRLLSACEEMVRSGFVRCVIWMLTHTAEGVRSVAAEVSYL